MAVKYKVQTSISLKPSELAALDRLVAAAAASDPNASRSGVIGMLVLAEEQRRAARARRAERQAA